MGPSKIGEPTIEVTPSATQNCGPQRGSGKKDFLPPDDDLLGGWLRWIPAGVKKKNLAPQAPNASLGSPFGAAPTLTGGGEGGSTVRPG